MGTLNNRIKELAQAIFTAMDFDQPVYVSNGQWHWSATKRGNKPSRCKHIRVSHVRGTKQAENVASVFCAVAKAHGVDAHWTLEMPREVVIHVEVAHGVKNSQALTGMPNSYTALAGFEGNTNSDLQLFGGQGFSAQDTERVLSLLK